MTLTEPGWLDLAKEHMARALCAVFSLEWESDETLDFMRYAYTDDAPQPPRTKDVLYIDMTVTTDPPSGWISTSFSTPEGTKDTASVQETVALICQLVFYGPHSPELAQHARTVLMIDTGPGSPRDILRQYNMVIVERPDAPTMVREPDENMWRQRADLTVRVNLLHTIELDYSPISGAPDINVSVRP